MINPTPIFLPGKCLSQSHNKDKHFPIFIYPLSIESITMLISLIVSTTLAIIFAILWQVLEGVRKDKQEVIKQRDRTIDQNTKLSNQLSSSNKALNTLTQKHSDLLDKLSALYYEFDLDNDSEDNEDVFDPLTEEDNEDEEEAIDCE